MTPLSPQTPFVSVAPLVFVLLVSAIKEAIEDYVSDLCLIAVAAAAILPTPATDLSCGNDV